MHFEKKTVQFQYFLNSKDRWDARPLQFLLDEKEEIIHIQQIEIDKLKSTFAASNRYEVLQKIRIEDDHLSTVFDLIRQLRDLELPSGRKLLRSDHKSPYFKWSANISPTALKKFPLKRHAIINRVRI